MTRKRWIQDPKTGELIPAEQYQRQETPGVFVIGDLKPYKSMVTGEIIEGRTQHREHLKTHGVVEVGNDLDNAKARPVYQPGRLKEQIARVVYDKLRY